MLKPIRLIAAACVAALIPSMALAQTPASRVLFRVFLSDGRVLSSYGEWARLDDRVIFSMPTQLTRDPIELHLVSIPAQRVDWARTELYAESVRAAAYAASRGDADFGEFTTDVAKTLNEVAQIPDPGVRLATAERARRKLAEWPATHYGYRNSDVREALSVLDEVISDLRVAVGITRFDLSLSSADVPTAVPPPPPLPPPSDAELVEQFVAAASVTESPVERVGLLQNVLRLLDRAVGALPSEWASRMRRTVTGDLDREQRIERAYDELRTRTLETASKLAAKGQKSDLEKLRDKVKEEDRKLGGHRPGDVASLLATIDLQASTADVTRQARKEWDRLAPQFRRYRRSTNGAFNAFKDAVTALEQIKSMNGPPVSAIPSLTKRLDAATRRLSKVTPPFELAPSHAQIASGWELAASAFKLRTDAVSSNNLDVAQRASSAAAGALMLYQRGRSELLTAMEPPAGK